MHHKLSEKQILSFADSDKRLNIWEGSVRSGKSFVSILRFLKELRQGPPGDAMIIGQSRDAIQRNVLSEICNLIAVPLPTPKATQMRLFGRTIYLVGASDERAQRRIQGSTLAIAYCDEVTLMPEGFFTMLLSRLSKAGAKLFGTTNPDSPFHWFKTKYLDRKDLEIAHFKFVLDDNPSLTQDYIEALKKEYTGLWYKRYIEGKWVLADGAVYDFFDEDLHVIVDEPGPAQNYFVSIDYGTTNPCVFLLFGYNSMYNPNIWCLKEYYYDSKKELRQKTDVDYADDLEFFLNGITPEKIYIDPSAASFKTELLKRDFRSICDAKNDVMNGIRFQSQMLTNGTYKIHCQCVNTIKEYSNYVWDSRSVEKGEDKPLKIHDHCFAANTPVLTTKGYVPIQNIKQGDLVVTPFGIDQVYGTWESLHPKEVVEVNLCGKSIVCTDNHRFLTTTGKKMVRELTHKDTMLRVNIPAEQICKFKHRNLTAEHIENTHAQKILAQDYILDAQTELCTGTYGYTTTGQSKKECISTTLMEITPTTQLKIYAVSQNRSMQEFTGQKLLSVLSKQWSFMAKKCETLLNNGIKAKQELNGTQNTQKNKTEEPGNLFACLANKNIRQKAGVEVNFALTHVNQSTEEITKSIMKRALAAIATKCTNAIGFLSHHIAANLVVRKKQAKQKVYNLTTLKYNCYVVDGIAVANCKDAERYFLFTEFYNKNSSMTQEHAEALERAYHPKYYRRYS